MWMFDNGNNLRRKYLPIVHHPEIVVTEEVSVRRRRNYQKSGGFDEAPLDPMVLLIILMPVVTNVDNITSNIFAEKNLTDNHSAIPCQTDYALVVFSLKHIRCKSLNRGALDIIHADNTYFHRSHRLPLPVNVLMYSLSSSSQSGMWKPATSSFASERAECTGLGAMGPLTEA